MTTTLEPIDPNSLPNEEVDEGFVPAEPGDKVLELADGREIVLLRANGDLVTKAMRSKAEVEYLREYGYQSNGFPLPVKRKSKISVRDWIFVQAYTDYGEPTFGNAVKSYIKAYPERKDFPRPRLQELARGFKRREVIQREVSEALEDKGFTDHAVDFEHLKVMQQDKDLSNKMRAIQEYNRLKRRGAQEQQQVTVNVLSFQNDTDHIAASVQSAAEAVSVRDITEPGEE